VLWALYANEESDRYFETNGWSISTSRPVNRTAADRLRLVPPPLARRRSEDSGGRRLRGRPRTHEDRDRRATPAEGGRDSRSGTTPDDAEPARPQPRILQRV